AAERDQDPRGREQDQAEANRAHEIEPRGLACGTVREHAPREREPGRAERHVDEEDPAPVDRREEPANERTDGRADRRGGAHDPELGAASAARDRLAQEAEAIWHEGGGRDRLIDPKYGEQNDRARRGPAGRRDREVDERGE